MLALILFLLWHPALSVATLRPQQNVVAVLVDDSRSMGITDAGGTREAAAKRVLDSGLLKSLSERFQVRIYKFGKRTGAGAENRTVERVRAGHAHRRHAGPSAGGIVVAAAGRHRAAQRRGGQRRRHRLDTLAALRKQRIPVHTIGFGREHPNRDVEITDAVLPARALPQSRLTATVTFSSFGFSGSRAKLSVRDNGKVLASQEVTLPSDGRLQTESLVFNGGDAGPKTFEIGIDPLPARRTPTTM
jgi:hypothetical protein